MLSDVDGRFAFLALPAGSFTVTAGKAGFAKTTFGARSPGAAGTPIRLAGRALDNARHQEGVSSPQARGEGQRTGCWRRTAIEDDASPSLSPSPFYCV